jgi:hypothetical protein
MKCGEGKETGVTELAHERERETNSIETSLRELGDKETKDCLSVSDDADPLPSLILSPS